MNQYSVQQTAKMVGVSVRTLHLYDQNGLLKPAVRTTAGYRYYGAAEVMRLQQILFYKQLGFPLADIRELLNKTDTQQYKALENQRNVLLEQQQETVRQLAMLDESIVQLKLKIKMTQDELYAGLPGEKALAYRKESIEKYGKEAIETSEEYLKSMGKPDFKALLEEQKAIGVKLLSLIFENPESEKVQSAVARHYAIIRQFWGTAGSADKQAEAYAGLGQLYLHDERFTLVDGEPNPEYALFLSKAMAFFAETQLK